MRYFREGRDKFDFPEDNQNGSLKDKKKAKKKKSGASDGDWTWKDRIDMVKWTDRMITVSDYSTPTIHLAPNLSGFNLRFNPGLSLNPELNLVIVIKPIVN